MNSALNMTYNSQKDLLKISEYGRNVQNLIDHCKGIEDKEYRQAFAERIVNLMWQMNPSAGPRDDARKRFWTHLMMIANYELDITVPEGIEIVKFSERKVNHEVVYPSKNKRYRQYGMNVQSMINKAIEMEDEAKQKAYIKVIGSFMKLAYRNWSNDYYVNDENIKNDMLKISDGKLKAPEDMVFDISAALLKKKKQDKRSNNKRSNNRSRHNNRSNNNRRRR